MVSAVKRAVTPHYNMVAAVGWTKTILLLDEHANKFRILLENEIKLWIDREV